MDISKDTDIRQPKSRQLVAEALSWLKTPYKANCSEKGKGVDCVRFIAATYQNCDLLGENIKIPKISRDLIFEDANLLHNEMLKYFEIIGFDNINPGDVVSYFINGIESHLAIYIGNDKMIHAVDKSYVKCRSLYFKKIANIYRVKNVS